MTSITRTLIRICFARKIMSPTLFKLREVTQDTQFNLSLKKYTPFSFYTIDCNNAQKEVENSIVKVRRNVLKTPPMNSVPLSCTNKHVSFI